MTATAIAVDPTSTPLSLSLPILSDPSFHLLSGDILVNQQLNSWGIKIGPVSVDVGIDLSALTDFLSPSSRQRRSRRSVAREEKRLLGLGLLNLGLNFGTPTTTTTTTAFGTIESKALLNLNIGLDPTVLSWGDADDTARGERGDTEWYTYISVGTPPQSLPILPDTGSSDLYIFGPTCKSCSLSNHTSFSPQLSSTYTNLTKPWSFLYADGSGARGYRSQDVVGFGSTSLGIGMNFAIATAVGGSGNSQSKRSGVLGLGLDGMSTISSDGSRGSTLFSRLVRAKAISESVLSVRLVKGVQSQGVVTQEGGGKYTLGGIEENYVVGGRAGLTWVPVMSSNYWGLAMDDILMGSTSVLSSDTTTPRRAIIDTGTTLIITSNAVSSSIHSFIRGSQQDPSSSIWYIPCNVSYPTVQNVFFSFGGKRFGVPISDLAWKVSTKYAGMCISGVQGGMSSFTVLGDMFIKDHYVVFSYGSEKEDKIQVGLGDRTDVLPIF